MGAFNKRLFTVRYLSVCSGIEAATVAWHDLGWKPAGFSEIEKFPSALLTHHYPRVTNFGDMTNYNEWNINEPINLLVGGTPCQSFSVAGLRKGLADPRGNLALVYLGIADRFKPKWIVWENVPGVLSSNGGRDFGAFLGALEELGYGFAYRVLDAQYFGVPQRRRRVFVVGCLGGWRSAAAVLFERESLSGDPAPSRSERKDITSFTSSSFAQYSEGVGTVRAFYENHPADSRVTDMGEVCTTVTSRWGTGGGNVPYAQKGMQVRRLTPMECERLQGFPDNYTNIPNASDSHRYKALGNSMAVPVMKWIGKRIAKVDALTV